MSGEFGRPNLLFFNSYFSVLKLMTDKFLATNCYVFCVYIPLYPCIIVVGFIVVVKVHIFPFISFLLHIFNKNDGRPAGGGSWISDNPGQTGEGV